MAIKDKSEPKSPRPKQVGKHPGVKPGVKGFSRGLSGNPKGRPKGSRNKATLMAQALFDEQGEAIVQKVIELALEDSDLTALKICLDRLLPPLRSLPVQFDLPEIKNAEDILIAHGALIKAVSQGQLTPEEATSVSTILDAARRAVETAELDARLARIEAKLEAEP